MYRTSLSPSDGFNTADYFGTNLSSPIPPEDRESFDGLEYYPLRKEYQFELPLHEHEDNATVPVGTSTGGKQDYLRLGKFRFEIDGETVTLQAYKSDPEDDRLWVPFRDVTSGEETYGTGRNLDLEADTHQTDDDIWILDFTEAYNPTCTYSDHYECPLPPTENWLGVAIKAGEKAHK
ncbi:DUF1684 domain-containing protein [Haloplanus sp. GCM10025708]|uniref:DUF1684 domain-containing protein n=1 Tax=Haloferacaceae TaxID=1644056 RepID=UPI003611CF2B